MARSKVDMLAAATRFELEGGLVIERRGEAAWTVLCTFEGCLREDFAFEDEPFPSARDAAFIARTRFSLDGAFELADRYLAWIATLEIRVLDRAGEPQVRDRDAREVAEDLAGGALVRVIVGSEALGKEHADLRVEERFTEGGTTFYRGTLHRDLDRHRGRRAGESFSFPAGAVVQILAAPGSSS